MAEGHEFDQYSDKVMEHYSNPRNMGEIENPDGVGEVGNPKCGDIMKLFIKVENNKIRDVKFKTFGCAAAIATSSMITELIKDEELDNLENITNKTVTEALDGLPKIKLHCSVLAEDALEDALKNYRENKNGETEDE